ncbi:hypothetical protein [Ornithinibacillus sp. FSL M8-0202]|uniref:hypothetical protein n=1 Tax=Ornithinibacillus sp. FSL M8-0202 TaxID=2921616 RepID=UPI0030D0E5D4
MLNGFSAYKYILRETRRFKWIPIDIIDLERLKNIGDWFKKEDANYKKVLLSSIKAEHERWMNVTPILMIIVPLVTIFFTFFISFSIGLMNIGSNIYFNKESFSEEVLKELNLKDISVDMFLDELITTNTEGFIEFLLTSMALLIFIISVYYWKINRLAKVKNIIETYAEETTYSENHEKDKKVKIYFH